MTLLAIIVHGHVHCVLLHVHTPGTYLRMYILYYVRETPNSKWKIAM